MPASPEAIPPAQGVASPATDEAAAQGEKNLTAASSADTADGADATRAASAETDADAAAAEELEAIHARNAFIRALDEALTDVRQRSYEGKLTTPARWRKRAVAPAGMTAQAFEEAVLDYLESHDHGVGNTHLGRVAAPKPLSVELEEQEIDPDQPLPELAVNDIVIRYGKKATYLYSEYLLANNYAQILFLTAEDDDMATFVSLVRDESKTYPRPMDETNFFNPPFMWTRRKVREQFERAQKTGSFPDIKCTVTTRNQRFYYSDLYLSDAQAKALAQFYGVERGMNP